FIVAAGLLNAEEIRLVHDLALHPSVQEICDRKASLEYRNCMVNFVGLPAHKLATGMLYGLANNIPCRPDEGNGSSYPSELMVPDSVQ
ncbi:unnamed protein product, partial [Symbiodinium necroappetens]